MTAATASNSARRRAALLSLAVGFVMLFGKWTAFAITGSYAILSDALESIVHVVATAFAFASILLAERPPDLKYPYGYGKIGYFSAGFEGGLIALAGLAILYEAAVALVVGSAPSRLDVGMLLIAAAAAINLWLGLHLMRLGKRENSLILVADGQHVLADSYTSLGVLVGVGLVWLTGLAWLDGLVAIAFGVNILWTGWGLVRGSFSGLMDRADPALLGRIVAALQAAREPGWIDLHQLRAWQAGDRVFVDFHLAVPRDWTVGQVHDANDLLHDLLRRLLGAETELIVHFDPDRPDFDMHRPGTVETATRIPGLLHDDSGKIAALGAQHASAVLE
jgi:cation diffusion facilitator family transporter